MRRYVDDLGIETLETALFNSRVDRLRQLAALTGEKAPSRKAEIIDLIIGHLRGDRLRRVWEGLDELQKAAVAEVVHGYSARFDAGQFRAKYGREPDWGKRNTYGSTVAPSPLQFFFHENVMPDDLRARLEEFVPAPRRAGVTTLDRLPDTYPRPFERWNAEQRTTEKGTDPVPLTVHEGEPAAQRELFSVLRLVDSGKVMVSSKTGRASASTVEAVTAILEGGDYYPRVPAKSKWHDENAGPIRAFAWPVLIQAGGLAQLSGTRLQLTKAGRKALSTPAAATIRTLWKKWLTTTKFDELTRIECVKGQTGKGKRWLTALASRREAIAVSLAECPPGRWVQTDEFLRYMKASGNDFEVTRNGWHLYLSDPQYGSFGYDGCAPILNTRYVFALLLEYATTLGIIDAALIPPAGARRDYRKMWGTDDLPFFSRYDGLMYFRVTQLGAWCLGARSEYKPEPMEVKPVLKVMPNLDIAAASPELEASDRLALDTYAVPVSDFVWRLEAGKLLAAVEQGRPVEELREFLLARSGAPIPDTVSRLIEDVAERSTKLRDQGLGRLVECADAALAALIANDARTGKHCMRAGERHLVIPAASEAAFRRALRAAGYLVSPEAAPRAARA